MILLTAYAKWTLDASLGPYIGHHVSREQIDGAEHNEWLWEVRIPTVTIN